MKGIGDTCPFVWPLGTAGAKFGGGTTAADCEEIPVIRLLISYHKNKKVLISDQVYVSSVSSQLI